MGNAVEFDRARETSRRQSAVETLLAMGHKWKDGKWWAPRSERAESAQRVQDTHDAAMWRVLVENSEVEKNVGDQDGIYILLRNPEDMDLTDYGPELDEIISELSKHLLEINHGIKL